MNNKENKNNNNEQFGIVPITNIELRPLIRREDIHKNLASCIVEMISTYTLPYYGEFCQFVNFFEANIGTCGVNVGPNGMNFYWDRKWVETQNRRVLIFTIVHEVFHLLFDHQKRGVGYDKKIANLAADMIINSIIHGDLIIGEGLDKKIEIPKNKYGKNSIAFLPKEYNGEPIFEEVYHWLNKKYNKWKNENSHKFNKQILIDKDGNIIIDNKKYCDNCNQNIDTTKQSGQENKDKKSSQSIEQNGGQENKDKKSSQSIEQNGKCPKCGQNYQDNSENKFDDDYGKYGKSGDNGQYEVDMYSIEKFFENIESNKGHTFDIHFDDDVPNTVKKQFVESIIEKLKNRGLVSNNVEKILNKLRKSEKDYLKEIKRILSNDIFGNKKNKTITRPNRKNISGIKGKKKYKTYINCILDTSGSMEGDFERVLSYIFQNDIAINLIQCDTEVKYFVHIKEKKELIKMPIKGLGGTILNPALKYIAENKKLNKYNTVILTDGYTDALDITGIKGNVLVLSTSINCPVIDNCKKLKQIIIDKNNV